MAGVRSRRGLSAMLGWGSLSLAASQLLGPGRTNRLIGIRDSAANNAAMRAVGLQELAFAAGLLARPRNAGLLWGRVAGDVTHLLVLSIARRARGNDRRRVAAAAGAVGGVLLVDVLAATRSSRRDAGGLRERFTVTVNRPPDEVYRQWRDLERLPRFMRHLESVRVVDSTRSHWAARAPGGGHVEWDAEVTEDVPGHVLAWRSLPGADIPNSGAVRLRPAPGDAGTEVTVELEYELPGGAAGRLAAGLVGEEPAQQAKDALRRFKQVVETGEVARSDAMPEGGVTQRQLLQGAAQPAEAAG